MTPPLGARGAGAVALLLLPACLEYNPVGKPEDSAPRGTDEAPDDTAVDTDPSTETDSAPPDEACDGVDNDGDGLVDESFDDADGDAVADCVDTTCAIALDGAEGVSEAHTCTHVVTPAVSPWEVEQYWVGPSGIDCFYPVVWDLDGDGGVEIVCHNLSSTYGSWVISGRDGALRDTWNLFVTSSALALGDLDRDGNVEIVGFTNENPYLVSAVDTSGLLVWTSAVELSDGVMSYALEIRDVEQNGTAEVVTHKGAVAGADGRAVARWDRERVRQLLGFELTVDDFDRDDDLELAYLWALWDTTVDAKWDLSPPNDESFAIPVPVQADSDDEAELVWSTRDVFVQAELDGTINVERAFAASDRTQYGIPCAGDIDGDGEMEVVSNGASTFKAWELDGRDMWTVPMVDVTDGAAACTTFDFDLDGAKEVVAVDNDAMYILDGATGATLVYADGAFATATATDSVMVVDLDGDGSVEILVSTPGMTGLPTLFAWRNVNRDWPPGTQMWPSATWSGTSLLPDGRVPRTPAAPWLTTKVWRGQPEAPVFGSDLQPEIGDSCVASCADEGEVRVEVRLVNLGPDEIEAGAPLAVYGLDNAGARVLLDVLPLPEWLDDGRAAASWEVVTTTDQARRGLVFVAGDDGTGSFVPDDCATTNNTVTWALTECG